MNGSSRNLVSAVDQEQANGSSAAPKASQKVPQWDWDVEHADRALEAKADAALHGATPFQVDRRVLKDVVHEKTAVDVARITFLSAGTFHKAYLVLLVDGVELVARVARRFMPRLKTESEVATMQYLRENTNVPVPTVYTWDSNPYNRLGGEYILMSKAPGIPLSQVYHSLGYNNVVKLLTNLAEMILPLFAHRFSKLGSLYFGPNPNAVTGQNAITPKAVQMHYMAFPFSPRLSMSSISTPKPRQKLPRLNSSTPEFHVGPIISWPFFGSNRGELVHPNEINRGPWTSSQSYFLACAEREVNGVVRENEGKSAPHRLHLDPDEIMSSRHRHMEAVPGDQSDDSDEWDLEESEEEWEGPGDVMYRDYRRNQRSTFLVAHIAKREEEVKEEMGRWLRLMERLTQIVDKGKAKYEDPGVHEEEFGLDCHDLSLENVFVDAEDHNKITCVIDWESTTTRPLWQCAHLPAFLQSSPFTAKLFRAIVVEIASKPSSTPHTPKPTDDLRGKPVDLDLPSLAREWLFYEAAGVRLRMAHRCVEWDGWEEGLAESILGSEETEEDWCHEIASSELLSPTIPGSSDAEKGGGGKVAGAAIFSSKGSGAVQAEQLAASLTRLKPSGKLPFVQDLEKEQVLNTTGDICGGRGGELGRRLEAWLTLNGNEDGHLDVAPPRKWAHDEDKEDEAEAD